MDEEAANVVRRIFQMAVNGKGPGVISTTLRDEKVETPSYYKTTHGICNLANITDMTRPYDWNAGAVSNILSKPEYMGHTVNFRTVKESYKSKQITKRPQEDWVIIENTHEAIIDEDVFERVQEMKE